MVQSVVRSTRRGSAARAAAIAEAAAKVVLLGPRGRRGGMSERTLRGWIARYEAKGVGGLIRKAARTTNQPNVQLSPEWDAAMLTVCAKLGNVAAVANAVRVCIRAAWLTSGGGWRRVQVIVFPTVASLSKAAGLPLSGQQLDSLCMLPRRTIERDRLAMGGREAGRARGAKR